MELVGMYVCKFLGVLIHLLNFLSEAFPGQYLVGRSSRHC